MTADEAFVKSDDGYLSSEEAILRFGGDEDSLGVVEEVSRCTPDLSPEEVRRILERYGAEERFAKFMKLMD